MLNTKQKVGNLKSLSSKTVSLKTVLTSTVIATALAITGCATTELLEGNNNTARTTTTNTKQVLVEDQLVAFGRPAQPLPNMPSNSVVIVGEKNSYVLMTGGTEMINILTNLTPKNIRVDNNMDFYSPNNDGYFQGQMRMSYAKLKDEFGRSDYQFFLQNGGVDCTDASDARINAQRFCFTVPIKGAVYPQVSNLDVIQSKYRALSKAYPMTIYTNKQTTTGSGQPNTAQKLVFLPFALAFDVVTLPFQLLGAGSQ